MNIFKRPFLIFHWLLLTCLCVSQVTLLYAANVPPGTPLAKQQVFIRGIGAEPSSLDPQLVEGSPGGFVVRDLFEGLVTEDDTGKIVPGQAASWTVSKDKTIYTFTLRDNARWSNGEPVTANDFVFTFRRAVDPQLGSSYGWYMDLIGIKHADAIIKGKLKPTALGIRAIDQKTLEITLKHPLSYFIKTLAHYTTFPVHPATVKKHGEKWTQPEHIVTNGPYKLTKWVVNERMEAKRNPYYWDNSNTIIEQVTFLPIESANTELNRYKAGELHWTREIPEDHFNNLKKTIAAEVKSHGIASTYFYSFNTQTKPFNDVRIRKALYLAMDRDILANKVLGMGEIPAYSLTPPYIDGYVAINNPYANMSQQQRNTEARQLLAEAGYHKSKPLTFELLYNTNESHKRIALAASAMWKQNLKYVKVNLINQEWKTFLSTKRQGQFELARYGWNGDYNEPSTMLSVMASTSGANDGKYNSPQYDELLTKAATAKDPSPYYQQAEKLLITDFPIIPFYYYVSRNLLKPNVKGYLNKNPLNNMYTKNLYIIDQ
ncbi:peptide ABC transporter substrate-binding protein [Spartinivicinus poritis]|uniref:Peptide ABC transporter substrate-binding protein n=1 Tax=Spartinivicinus poritis TaxID=2994640 RepID=A0ABT5U2U5_9GAMM|nr:peptide ABC transporter substrate-binding protein [Spartinivicinus sp. A2-2]MDE1460685.1 peptide ABC transporter substrate-binding protein [Spartinivicinus sp. A2-2]